MAENIIPEPEIIFSWGVDGSEDKFMNVEQHEDRVRVTLHPGLSRAQVILASRELGEHGPAILRQWERLTGLTD